MLARFQAALRDFVPVTSERGGNFFAPPGDLLPPLESEIRAKGFAVDAARLLGQWERAGRSFKACADTLEMGLIHADLWPPNVVSNGDEVAGLIDFDDCCFGAIIIDFAVALMEFTMFRSASLNRETAPAFVSGYLEAGGSAASLMPERIVEAMEMACALWVYWEIIELPALMEGEKCLQRLALFDDAPARADFTAGLVSIFSQARDLAQAGQRTVRQQLRNSASLRDSHVSRATCVLPERRELSS
jgi:Ser/Thr protein kinase RdoA (MazF antagonist)